MRSKVYPALAIGLRAVTIFAAVLIGGCAVRSGIVPAGPDTYTITENFAPILGGSVGAQQEALTKASELCAQKGREFVPTYMGESQAGNIVNHATATGYAVTFRCLLANDPAVTNYRLGQAPNIIIEERNR